MDESTRNQILLKAKHFFYNEIVRRHIKNTEKLSSLKTFNVNPFLVNYVANLLTGNNEPKSIARALVYPRALGTSISTSFGTHIQTFCSSVLEGFGSTTSGIDIEFIDQLDGRKKYCQLKSGPTTINKDDVETIINHFKACRNLARTNNVQIGINDMIVGVMYGTPDQLSFHYKRIDEEFPVYIGKEFWHRLTGDPGFYQELTNAFGEVALDVDGKELLESVINRLAKEISEQHDFL